MRFIPTLSTSMRRLSAALIIAAAITPAQAACDLTDVSPTSFACFSAGGNDVGAFTASTAAAIAAEWGGLWSLVGTTDDVGFGPFTSNPQASSGTLTFDTPQNGVFVVTFKAGNGFDAHLFDDAVSAISFTLPKDLSHASLWAFGECKFGGCPVSPIPEPTPVGMLLAGLGALGLLSLRRKL